MAKVQLRDFNNLLVGALLTACAIVLAVAAVAVLDRMDIFREDYHLKVVFEQCKGLNVGTMVKINGVEVGKVSSIELTENGSATLVLQLAKRFSPHITSTSVAFPTRDQNLISDRIIMISHGVGGHELEDGDYIRADEAQDIETFLANANAVLGRVNATLNTVDSVLGMVIDTNRTLGAIIGKNEVYNEIQAQLDKLDQITTRAYALLGSVDKDFVQPITAKTDRLMGSAIDIADKGSAAMDNVNDLVKRVNETFDHVTVLMERVSALLASGEDKLERADDLMNGVSGMWPVRNSLPDRTQKFDMTKETW